MQKNYRDYTVGELLDMGVNVEVNNFDVSSKKDGEQFISKFEGIKSSSKTLEQSGTEVVQGWKTGFRISCFVMKED